MLRYPPSVLAAAAVLVAGAHAETDAAAAAASLQARRRRCQGCREPGGPACLASVRKACALSSVAACSCA
jgi:hypothetical protein